MWVLERDVVARGTGSNRRCLLEVRGVRGDVRLGLDPVALRRCAAVAAAQELHRVGEDREAWGLRAVVRLPLAPVETALDCDGPALGEIGGAVLALGAPD